MTVKCQTCGALSIVTSRDLRFLSMCLQCHALFGSDPGRPAAHAGTSEASAPEPVRRVRLYWDAGYVSDYSADLSDLDCQTITLHTNGTAITLHAIGGMIHHFTDAAEEDEHGYRVFRERPHEQQATHSPPVPSRPFLAPADTFDYVVSMPAAGQAAICEQRQVELTTQEPSGEDRLLGKAPQLQIEPVGPVAGGGALSPLSDIVRPAFLGSRVTLTAHDSAHTTAMRAWFYFPQGLSVPFGLATLSI